MQMLTKICRKSEPSPLVSYENTVTERTKLRPVKAVYCEERFLSWGQIDEFHYELKWICL